MALLQNNIAKKLLQAGSKLPPAYQRWTRDEVLECINRNYGIVTLLCAQLDCSYKQLYNCIDHYGLREELAEAKKNLVGIAESALLECLHSENEQIKLRAAETTLKSLDKETWGQGPQIAQQITFSGDNTAEIKQIFFGQ